MHADTFLPCIVDHLLGLIFHGVIPLHPTMVAPGDHVHICQPHQGVHRVLQLLLVFLLDIVPNPVVLDIDNALNFLSCDRVPVPGFLVNDSVRADLIVAHPPAQDLLLDAHLQVLTRDTGLSGWDGGDDQALLALLDVHFLGDVAKYGAYVPKGKRMRLYEDLYLHIKIRLKLYPHYWVVTMWLAKLD
jgi:hypothetical protein